MKTVKVLLDANVLKFSATVLPRLLPREKEVIFRGKTNIVTVHDYVYSNPNQFIGNTKLKAEADLLPLIAAAEVPQGPRYLVSSAVLEESLRLGNMDSRSGLFYGANIEFADLPIRYFRILSPGDLKPGDHNFHCLLEATDSRFLELQKITGAYQGKNLRNRNQLLDAFHLWCAEFNACSVFLTLDFKLINVLHASQAKTSVNVFRPSEFLRWLKENRESA